MKTYVIMADQEGNTVTAAAEDNYNIKKRKKQGYEIIGRVKVHNGFKVLGVNVK